MNTEPKELTAREIRYKNLIARRAQREWNEGFDAWNEQYTKEREERRKKNEKKIERRRKRNREEKIYWYEAVYGSDVMVPSSEDEGLWAPWTDGSE